MIEITDIIIRRPKSLVISDDVLKILQMTARDVPRQEIAAKMKLSIRTVEAHIDKTRRAFGLKTSTALIAELMRRNIIK